MMFHSAYTITAPGSLRHGGFSSTEILSRPPGYLDLEQRRHLTAVAEKLRMSRDLALALAGRHSVLPLAASAQSQEVTAIRHLLSRYGLADRNREHPPGRFTDRRAQAEYDRLLSHGHTGPDAAVAAAQEALRGLLAALDTASARVHAPDVRLAYRQLSAVAGRRLRALQQSPSRYETVAG